MRNVLTAAMVVASIFCVLPLSARAEMTNWMTAKQLSQFMKSSKAAQWYPVSIECKAGGLVRIDRKNFTANSKPFHKWNWIMDRHENLQSRVQKLELSDRPDLKYRIVSSGYYTEKGVKYGCAIVYR